MDDGECDYPSSDGMSLGSLHLLPIAATMAIIILVRCYQAFIRVNDGTMDASTEELLTGSKKVRVVDICEPLVTALETAEFTEDESVCAAQIRSAVAESMLSYRSLAEDPGIILRCSRHMEGQNGALWTRFTVQYNLYAGSIVALGTDEQRERLFVNQAKGTLGCFAFTEKGAGVLSGLGVETTATYDVTTDEFVLNSPTPSSVKNWISQGLQAEAAVILAEIIIGGESQGPHLFWADIADRSEDGVITSRPGVVTTSLPLKTALRGLDNATIAFKDFRVQRSGLLSRFCTVNKGGDYKLALPKGCKRMVDILLSRLLTGRICLSEASIAHAMSRVRRSYEYTKGRELWRGRKERGAMMVDMPLVRGAMIDYSRTLAILARFLEATREEVAECIRNDTFNADMIEATCMCKFLGTGFAVDSNSVMRKVLGAQALMDSSWLGDASFLPNATSAAEGDNTVMELKVVQDMVRGRTSTLPLGLFAKAAFSCGPQGRRAVAVYLIRLLRAQLLGKRALQDGQLLKDLAWARAHLRVLTTWSKACDSPSDARPAVSSSWLQSYERVLMRFPVPVQA